jgi:hypothetical protein
VDIGDFVYFAFQHSFTRYLRITAANRVDIDFQRAVTGLRAALFVSVHDSFPG